MAADGTVSVRMFGVLRAWRAERGLPVERCRVRAEGEAARDVAERLELPLERIEGVFVNHRIHGLGEIVRPGRRDRVRPARHPRAAPLLPRAVRRRPRRKRARVTPAAAGRTRKVRLLAVLAVALALACIETASAPGAAVAAAPRNGAPAKRPVVRARGARGASVVWTSIGTSVQGRPILLASFGSGSRRVLYVGGMHGSEFGAPVAEAFAAFLASHPAAVPRGTRIDVIGCLNPDGRAAGRRGNANAVDLNRNLPASNWRAIRHDGCTAGPAAGSEPETKALLARLGEGYALVVALHSQGGIIDYDGPGAEAIARRVSAASGMPVRRIGTYTGSLGAYVPERLGVPLVTLELSATRLTTPLAAGLTSAARR